MQYFPHKTQFINWNLWNFANQALYTMFSINREGVGKLVAYSFKNVELIFHKVGSSNSWFNISRRTLFSTISSLKGWFCICRVDPLTKKVFFHAIKPLKKIIEYFLIDSMNSPDKKLFQNLLRKLIVYLSTAQFASQPIGKENSNRPNGINGIIIIGVNSI